MKIILDIDGTVCNDTYGEYEKAKPYQNMIDVINKLYDQGHIIIMKSARGFGIFKGDVGKIYNKWYVFTKNQLKSWGLKFHELHLGKYDADLFVDDKGFRVNDDGSSADELWEFINGK